MGRFDDALARSARLILLAALLVVPVACTTLETFVVDWDAKCTCDLRLLRHEKYGDVYLNEATGKQVRVSR